MAAQNAHGDMRGKAQCCNDDDRPKKRTRIENSTRAISLIGKHRQQNHRNDQ